MRGGGYRTPPPYLVVDWGVTRNIVVGCERLGGRRGGGEGGEGCVVGSGIEWLVRGFVG